MIRYSHYDFICFIKKEKAMFSKNNLKMNSTKQSEKINQYGIKKFNAGTASVLIASGFLFLGGAAQAAETTKQETPVETTAKDKSTEKVETPKAEVAESTTAAPQGEIPEGTVLGNGKIDFVLARIDTRLLHGQVATNWTKATHPNRIIVVSDTVSKDELRKKLIEQAAPPGVRAHVIPLDKLVQVYNDPRFGDTKALLLFETPQDALAVIEKGVEIPELNIGSMAHSVGKVQINNVLSLDQEDVEVYKKLRDLGVKFDVRKVSNDSPSDLFKLIEAKSSEGLKL